MYPKNRIESFTDAIFAVAMTLLALDVRLPEGFQPENSTQMLRGLFDLWPRLFPYALSFYVLGVRWLSLIRMRSATEHYSGAYVRYWLLFLFLVTFVPFTSVVVGRYVNLAPAIWLYAGTTALIGLVSFAMTQHTPGMADDSYLRDRRTSLSILIVSSVLAIFWSFRDPGNSLYALALNGLTPLVLRWRNKGPSPSGKPGKNI